MNLKYAFKCLATAVLCWRMGRGRLTPALAEPDKAEITVLYDAFGKTSTMTEGLGILRLHRVRRQAHPVRHRQ